MFLVGGTYTLSSLAVNSIKIIQLPATDHPASYVHICVFTLPPRHEEAQILGPISTWYDQWKAPPPITPVL